MYTAAARLPMSLHTFWKNLRELRSVPNISIITDASACLLRPLQVTKHLVLIARIDESTVRNSIGQMYYSSRDEYCPTSADANAVFYKGEFNGAVIIAHRPEKYGYDGDGGPAFEGEAWPMDAALVNGDAEGAR